MMSFIRFFLLAGILIPMVSVAQIDPANVRLIFPKATEDEKTCRDFIKQLQSVSKDDYLMRAYRGAANIVMAKFTSSPKERLDYFLEGKEELDLGVKKLPQNVEIRYLRFRIQENTPGMLFYDNNEEDLPVIIARLNEVKDPVYKEKIRNFVLDSGKCSAEQEKELKSK